MLCKSSRIIPTQPLLCLFKRGDFVHSFLSVLFLCSLTGSARPLGPPGSCRSHWRKGNESFWLSWSQTTRPGWGSFSQCFPFREAWPLASSCPRSPVICPPCGAHRPTVVLCLLLFWTITIYHLLCRVNLALEVWSALLAPVAIL